MVKSHDSFVNCFKKVGRRFFVDTATCGAGQSTAITYDLKLTSDLISMIAKTTGKPESQIKNDLNAISNKLKKG